MRVWIALWTVYLVWGSTYLAIRYVVDTMPALLSGGARFLLAGLLFSAWLVARGGLSALRVTRAELAGCAFVGVALLLGGNGLVSVGEDEGVPSGLAALVIASVPLWVVLFRRLAGERIGRTTPLWIAVGFAGVAVLLLPGDRPEDAPLAGMLILVAAAFSWASGSFASSRIAIPDDPVRATALQMLIGGSVTLLVGLAAGEGGGVRVEAFSWESIAAFAYLVVIGSLWAFTAYAWLLQNAPISQVATYAYVNPVVAIALGAVFVDEDVTPLMAVAAVVICASVAGTIREESSRRDPAVADEPAVA
ncbi:MAG TPA: EamA family transporter [Solirubrobacteraceae bacterium]|jgi:drug/metabolite transporter (DMT)-like permease|nr:EamA family transporter [Solirubrobacteraceae bacterium]